MNTNEAQDAAFDEFGETVTYTPSVGDQQQIVVLNKPRDPYAVVADTAFADDPAVCRTLLVRRLEVASPEEGATLTTADGQTYRLSGAPCYQHEGLWLVIAQGVN